MAKRENVMRLTDTEKSLIELLRNEMSFYNMTDLNQGLTNEIRAMIQSTPDLAARAEVIRDFQKLVMKVWEER